MFPFNKFVIFVSHRFIDMRIAVSGSHSLGKSTFVKDWIAAHPSYKREEEPYRSLDAQGYDIRFRQESNRLHNGIQLFYSISRVNAYAESNSNVIFDRSPVDYIAYSQYTADHGTTDIDDEFVKMMIQAARDSLANLDLLVFIPISEQWPIEMEDDGIRPIDIAYRDEVDAVFKQIYRDQRFDVMPRSGGPALLELWGSRQERLQRLEAAVASHQT